jgi:hypothetical protein
MIFKKFSLLYFIMMELYGLAEIHWEFEEFYLEILKDHQVFQVSRKKLDETYEKRKRKIQKFLQKYNPKVLFVEGTSYGHKLENTTYSGNIIFLDEHSKNYKKFSNGEKLIRSKYQPLFEELFQQMYSSSSKAVLQEIIKKWEVLEKNEENEIKEYTKRNFELMVTEREKEWANLISDDYEFPSCIIAGAFHFLGGLNNDLKILVNSVHPKIFPITIPCLLYRHGSNETLTYFLKQRGIKLKVSDCLFVF